MLKKPDSPTERTESSRTGSLHTWSEARRSCTCKKAWLVGTWAEVSSVTVSAAVVFSVVVLEAFSVVWEVSDWELPAGWEESSVMAVWESLFPDAWELPLVSPGACKATSLVFTAPGPLFESFLNAKAVVACPAMSAEARAVIARYLKLLCIIKTS